MKLIIVRHGETIENAAKIIMGHQHGQLSDLGKKQAEKLTQRLKEYDVDVIYASDLNRCQNTIAGFAKERGLPVIPDSDLREISRGVYENRPRIDLYDAIEKNGSTRFNFKPDNGENFIDVKKRVRHFLRKINKQHPDQTVLVCTHGGWIAMFLSEFLNIPLKKELNYFKIKNTAVNIFEINADEKHRVEVINCTKHLDEN